MVVAPTNAPSGTKGWHAIEVDYSEGNYYLKAYVFGTQREYSCRRRYSEDWSEWTPTATATKPQEFNLPLAEGFTNGGNASTYWKDQFGVVHVEFCVQKSGSTYETADVFATLPAGFRPKRRVHVGGIGDGITAGTGIIAMEVYIEPNGSMYLYHANSNIQWVVGEMSFLAAD